MELEWVLGWGHFLLTLQHHFGQSPEDQMVKESWPGRQQDLSPFAESQVLSLWIIAPLSASVSLQLAKHRAWPCAQSAPVHLGHAFLVLSKLFVTLSVFSASLLRI